MKKSELEKTIEGLGLIREFLGEGLPGQREVFEAHINVLYDAEELLKKQNEVIVDLLHVGYPHNFQSEELWVIRYMYEITDVIRKAVHLSNE